ncbi:ABC transporter permease [Enterococcus sp. 5H]|uniref:ABC transporter permease n=1 Tax=Enterococcus sp. 5H TaxID=1229490 RepID=UPI002303D624|nr:ABC transporter permease [Enterococcus sp. 5H]MDA9470394.1 membrane protein [Enterococcus sp. 5H]
MNKQLLTILKKRYGLFILIASIAIVGFYVFLGISDVNRWKEMELYYSSDDFITELKQNPEEINPSYKNLSLKERQEKHKKDSLMLFFQTDTFDDQGNMDTSENRPYFTMYFNENPWLLISLISLIGFSLFFVDLKTSFNEFLFSLGVSKRKIYFTKYLLIALPLLFSVLIAKILFIGIVTLGIPSEYVNLNMHQIVMNILALWSPIVFYFSVSTFIGLVTGHMILGPLTLFGFCFSFEFFMTSLTNALYFFTDHTKEVYMGDFFQYIITKNPTPLFPIIFALVVSILLTVSGFFLFPALTLEKKGNYLLFDKLKIPVIIATTIYVPIVMVFSQGFSHDESLQSSIVSLLIYAIITALIVSYIVFKKEIDRWIHQKKQIKEKISVRQ